MTIESTNCATPCHNLISPPVLSRWQKTTGTERANHPLFITELCQLLDLPPPDPATAKTPWPKTIPEQVKALRAALDQYPEPATSQQLARTCQLRTVGVSVTHT